MAHHTSGVIMRLGEKSRVNLRKLEHKARRLGVRRVLQEIRDMFDMEWPDASERIQTNSSIWLRICYPSGETSYWSYVQIVPDTGYVRLRFHPWAISLYEDGFTNLMQKIPYESDYYSHLGGDSYSSKPSVDLLLTPDEWNTHKGELAQLVRNMYTSYEPGIGIYMG